MKVHKGKFSESLRIAQVIGKERGSQGKQRTGFFNGNSHESVEGKDIKNPHQSKGEKGVVLWNNSGEKEVCRKVNLLKARTERKNGRGNRRADTAEGKKDRNECGPGQGSRRGL